MGMALRLFNRLSERGENDAACRLVKYFVLTVARSSWSKSLAGAGSGVEKTFYLFLHWHDLLDPSVAPQHVACNATVRVDPSKIAGGSIHPYPDPTGS